MNSDSKFFLGVAIVAVLVIGVIVFVVARNNNAPASSSSGQKTAAITLSYGHQKGDASAPVTVVEFGDFECPACGEAEPFVRQMQQKYASTVQFYFINFPLPIHPNAIPAARAAEAAAKQNKYWQMHDMLYDRQDSWAGLANPDNTFIAYAQQLGLNVKEFTTDYNSSAIKQTVQKDINYGNSLGLDETPTFYVNGKQVLGVQDAANWDTIITQAESQAAKK